jgi:hypothetical protein
MGVFRLDGLDVGGMGIWNSDRELSCATDSTPISSILIEIVDQFGEGSTSRITDS